uniref:Ig-like domain-containing protein n=1 Tax=Anopheles merus TaxID=30066 RepID=A0A182V981_ANOME
MWATRINRFLRNFNLSKINDLEVFATKTNAIPTGASSGGTSGTKAAAPATTGAGVGEVMFQFFGPKIDSSRVREAMEKMTERGRIGNVSLVPGTKLSFRQDVGLMLQSVVINQKGPIRENTEFILSCVAQGSSTMSFRWYKNGYFVNVTKATRLPQPEKLAGHLSLIHHRAHGTADPATMKAKAVQN